MDTHISDTFRQTWENYSDCWSDKDPAHRQHMLGHVLDEQCTYRDPVGEGAGRDGLDAYMHDFQQQYVGGHFVTTWFLAHHGRSIAQWQLRDQASDVIAVGTSYAEYTPDGKLRTLCGFFELP